MVGQIGALAPMRMTLLIEAMVNIPAEKLLRLDAEQMFVDDNSTSAENQKRQP